MIRLAALLALVLALAPEWASACAVCGAAADEDQSRIAYLVTTGVLSALPLALFGAFVLYLRRQHRRQYPPYRGPDVSGTAITDARRSREGRSGSKAQAAQPTA